MSAERPRRGGVHLIEVEGRGGIHQHAVGVAQALTDAGIDVVLHTASDAEPLDHSVRRCACMNWVRRAPNGIRQPLTAIRFLVRTCPHLVRATPPEGIAHVQGVFAVQLTAWLIRGLARRGTTIAFSPHNTFARSGRSIDEKTIRWMARRSDVTIAFSDHDQERLERWGATAARADLVHFIPRPTPQQRHEWSHRFRDRPVALLGGQVRADKRPDVFVEACRLADVTPAVVGPANDGEELLRRVSGDDVIRVDEYLPLTEFVAAVMASDVVVATHGVGSVSGPLAFATELGVRRVAPRVGGLSEDVTATIDGDGPEAAASAIRAALGAPRPAPREFAQAAEQHVAAYEIGGWRPPALRR